MHQSLLIHFKKGMPHFKFIEATNHYLLLSDHNGSICQFY